MGALRLSTVVQMYGDEGRALAEKQLGRPYETGDADTTLKRFTLSGEGMNGDGECANLAQLNGYMMGKSHGSKHVAAKKRKEVGSGQAPPLVWNGIL